MTITARMTTVLSALPENMEITAATIRITTSRSQNCSAKMRRADFFWLVVAPEGTRSYTNGWRTGFYHLWRAADCPLGLAYIDYAHKQIGVQHYVRCSGDMEADFAALARYYEGRTGYHPEKAAPVRPYERTRSRDAEQP